MADPREFLMDDHEVAKVLYAMYGDKRHCRTWADLPEEQKDRWVADAKQLRVDFAGVVR